MTAHYYTDIYSKIAIRTARCAVVAVFSLLACTGDNSTSSTSAPQPLPTPASTPASTPSFLESIKRSIGDATSEVHQAVAPHANELQTATKDEVKKLHQWEYLVDSVHVTPEGTELQTRLSVLGLERWECFSILPDQQNTLRLTCKRRPYSSLAYLKCLSGL